jgi:hypothetical protein
MILVITAYFSCYTYTTTQGPYELVFHYLDVLHLRTLFWADRRVVINNPLQCSWYYPLALQSTLRFCLLELAGRPLATTRRINDGGTLNTSGRTENRYKTENRAVHNRKMEFLLIQNEPTRMDLKTAFIYASTADSEFLCGKGFPWTQGHCDSKPFTDVSLGVDFGTKNFVFCSKCTMNYSEVDLHFLTKSTAILLAAGGLLHAKETGITVVIN